MRWSFQTWVISSCYYARAMYTSRHTFEEVVKAVGLSTGYDEVRREIADAYFEGDVGFTIHDGLEVAETSTGLFGGDGGVDGSGAEGGDGGDTD